MSQIKPIEQKQIAFQGREITAVMVQDRDGRENVYVPMKRLVEEMGLTWSSQYMRINRNPSLSKVAISILITRTDMPDGSRRPKTSKMLCLPLSHINGYLFSIDANRVKPEIKELEHHEKLQNEMSKGAFGVTTAEHRQLKQLSDNARLKDNMSIMELVISTFADETARGIVEKEGATGLEQNRNVAKRAGKTAGEARRSYEKATGGKVLTEKSHSDNKRPSLRDE